MLKKVMAMALTGMVLCSTTAGAYAADIVKTTVNQSIAQETANPDTEPAGFFFNDTVNSHTGYYTSGKRIAVENKGKIIQVYYENDTSVGAYIELRKKDDLGMGEVVLDFTVDAGKKVLEEYSDDAADSGTYYVRVFPESGTAVKGYVAFIQTIEGNKPIETLPFTDVSNEAWYKPQIEYVYKNGLFSGTSATTFSPEQDMTRAQIVTVLGNMHQKLTGETIEADAPDFSDVQDGAYYAKYIDWAQKNGIVAGFSDGKFHPDDVITREQLAVIVNKYIQISGKTLTGSHEYTPFTDEDQISSWAKDAVVNLVKYGIMSGSNNQFAPKNGVIRAEGAAVIANLHKNLV